MIWLKAGNQEFFNKKGEKDNREQTLIADSPVMKAFLEQIKQIAQLSSPVLLLGENGTGRKMIAREVFNNSINKNQFFLSLNCYGMDDRLIESKLFGSNKKGEEQGLLHYAEGNTLFIEGIETLSLSLQEKLLKAVQSFESLKNTKRIRLICSSDSNLPKKVEEAYFREDFFYYLSKNLLIVPSLKERLEDIPGLVSHFLKESSFTGVLTEKALLSLQSHSWKGNVRELKNICFQIATLCKNKTVRPEDIPISHSGKEDISLFITYNPKIKLEDLINFYILESLKHFKSKKKSARSLGISVKTIYNKIKSGTIKDLSESMVFNSKKEVMLLKQNQLIPETLSEIMA